MISPFYKFTAQPACFNIQRNKKLRLLLYTRDEVYPRFHSFKEYSYITRILPSVHVTCVIPNPAMTLFIFSPDRLPDALHKSCNPKLLSAGDSFSLSTHHICYSFRSKSFSYRIYIMRYHPFVNQFPANLRFKRSASVSIQNFPF